MKVTVKRGPTIHAHNGKALYAEWPNGTLTKNGKRISKAEAARLRSDTA